MGGIFGVVSKESCVFDLFFGVDYHSHLGTKKGGLTVYGKDGFERSIHNISNSPFRTKFEKDIAEMEGRLGIGCISDNEPQPLIVRSHLGTFSITTVGRINNTDSLCSELFDSGTPHFLEMSGGEINATELCAALINRCDTIPEGIRYAQSKIDGSCSLLILTQDGIYAARDLLGRTPLVIGKKDGAHCVSFESFAFINLGYETLRELGAGEIAFITAEEATTVVPPEEKMRVCSFLWVYYGYPTSVYEGVNVEHMRYKCGEFLAARDNTKPDAAAGVPDSGTAHAIGYANASGIPFSRPLIKYTPTWTRSFMPPLQSMRNMIAHMKLVPVDKLILNKSLLLIDDSIVRGTQMRETANFLYHAGAREVHVRTACPPILFGCCYLNFSRSTSDMDLITRRVIAKREGDCVTDAVLAEYADPDSRRHREMIEDIRAQLGFTSLGFNRLDDMQAAIGIDKCKLCTYCMNGCK